MADLGAIGKNFGKSFFRKVAPAAVRNFNARDALITDVPVDGTISGTVKIGGIAAANVLVRIYYRDNGGLIAQAVSDGFGAYSFTGLDTTNPGAYYVTFMDPNTGTPYNYTITHDHLSAG